MSWRLVGTHRWQSPLTLAAGYATANDIALLYSGRREHFTGRTSYLFITPHTQIATSDWNQIPTVSDTHNLPEWVGYAGYGMRLGLESYTRNEASWITLPDSRWIRYQHLFIFHHEQEQIEEYAWLNSAACAPPNHTAPTLIPSIATLQSNMTKMAYLKHVDATIARIHAGDFYQANITRKFFGTFSKTPDPWSVFTQLCKASPAPYSCFIKHGNQAILSSSPEGFLALNAQGTITARPIKGSAPRAANEKDDAVLRKSLLNSEKNAAENLMIVDLLRHDLGQVSEHGSVTVAEQSALYSYATIHHLVSTITAKKQPQASVRQVIQAAFPPGSMTGAPKIAAVQWCDRIEAMERGVYSGAIGWLGGQNTCDLSVVIRTILLEENRFEFQVGGGIVADSDAEDEWQETLIKARGIGMALGIREEALAAL